MHLWPVDYFNSLLYRVPDHHMQNFNISWMPVRDWSSAHLNTVILRRFFNNFTGGLSAYVSRLKSFWWPLKCSRAQPLNISLNWFLFYRNPVLQNNEDSTRGACWLAEKRVCMRVCRHGCDVKMFCFSRANHASANLKKFWVENLDEFFFFTHFLVGWNLDNL